MRPSRLKALALELSLLSVISAVFSVGAQEIFLESFWQNNVATPTNMNAGTAIWSGGNESSVANAPHSSNGFFLIESSVGQITPQTVCYPQAAAYLANLATTARQGGNQYRYDSFGNPLSAVAASAQLNFPGSFNSVLGTNGPVTFDTNQLNLAEYALRSALRINPLDTNSAQQLVVLTEDRMLPFELSGTEALAYSAKARILGLTTNGNSWEMIALGMARSYYRSACDVFASALANPSDAILYEGQNPQLSAGVSNQVLQVVDDYFRNLAQYTQASLAYFQLTNLLQFSDPAQQ
ncbi:MAG: hypothetical protein ACREIC_26965, partial [Limisphaerales bacterium]